ncbi:MAG: S8 family serine peptidase [Phycisphaerae bacterium]
MRAGIGRTTEKHFVPGELLVKFNDEAAASLSEQLDQKRSAAGVRLTEPLDRLAAAYGVEGIAPVFKDAAEEANRLLALRLRDPETLTEAEWRLLKRGDRAPPDAPVPALDRIFKLQLAPRASVEAAVDEFAKDPGVEFAEPNYYFYVDSMPNDPYFDKQWSLHNVGQPYFVPVGGTSTGTPDSDVDAPEAWEVYAPTEDVIVAIVDSGVDYDHPDLVANMWTDDSGYHGYDFVNDDPDPIDDLGHGTHCAGIVAAVSNNELGIAGLCPNARIMAVKFADSEGRGSAELAAQAIYYAVNNGADVISNSYSYFVPSETLKAAVEYAHSQGVIVVASAGNENTGVRRYPASYDHVISVASTDSDDVKAGSSSYGYWVDVSAPGVDILSLRAAGTDLHGDGLSIIDDEYYTASGTSMSCPHVAAVAAMIVSQYPALSSYEVTARLLGTTDEIVTQNPSESHLLGSGRLNAHNALVEAEHPAIVYADHEIHEDDDGDGQLDPGESALLLVSLRNLWQDASNVSATLHTVDPDLEISSAQSHFGGIAAGSEGTNAHEPFQLNLRSLAAPDVTRNLTLNVTAPDGYSRSLGLSLTRQIALQDGEWPRNWGFYANPIPYDLDGDGLIELIAKDQVGMHVLEPDGSVLAAMPGFNSAGAAVGDIQRDGLVEIVMTTNDYASSRICIWEPVRSNVALECVTFTSHRVGSPVLYDVDFDGQLEIIVVGKVFGTSQLAVRIVGWQHDTFETEFFEAVEIDEDHYYGTRVSVGNVNAVSAPGDRRTELVFASAGSYPCDGGLLFVLNSDGTLLDGWPVTLTCGGQSPTLADLTGDGNLEIIVNSYDYNGADGLRVWDHAGRLLWTGSGRGRDVVVGDLDDDGDLEVLTQTKAYHHDGTDTGWTYSVANPKGTSIADIDGDGRREVLIGGAGGDGLRGFEHDGKVIPGFPLYVDPLNRYTWMTPVLADLDGDGDIEAVTTGHYFAVWDLPGRFDRGRADWTMFRHDPHQTGCYNNGTSLPPVWFIAPGDRSFVRFTESELYVQATDPDRKTVMYAVHGIPLDAGYEPEGLGLRFFWRPAGDATAQDVTFCATDADGERVAKTIRITVTEPSADLNGDGDTDLRDYHLVWGCVTGPADPLQSGDCELADFDQDGDVDLGDITHFMLAYNAVVR